MLLWGALQFVVVFTDPDLVTVFIKHGGSLTWLFGDCSLVVAALDVCAVCLTAVMSQSCMGK